MYEQDVLDFYFSILCLPPPCPQWAVIGRPFNSISLCTSFTVNHKVHKVGTYVFYVFLCSMYIHMIIIIGIEMKEWNKEEEGD